LQSKQEAVVFEINFLINEVRHALFHLKEWTEPEKVRNRTWYVNELLFLLFSPITVLFYIPHVVKEVVGMNEMKWVQI
jgi:hypothetical protein